MSSFQFRKEEHLKSRKLIEALFREGKAFSVYPLKVYYYLPNQEETNSSLQVGFSVSSRQFKSAVHRNRIKRLMRESYRLQKAYLALKIQEKGYRLAAFFIYIGKELPPYALLLKKMEITLGMLSDRIDREEQRDE